MEIVKIKKGKIFGTISPPPSKSQTLRALIFAMLAKGKSTIYNFLPSFDTYAMLDVLKAYGIKTHVFKDRIEIIGSGGKINPPNDIINAQNSGIILRFIGAIAALNNTFSIITGDESIKKNRVILPLLIGLKQLNVYAESLNQDNRPPIIVKGPIKPNKIRVSGEDSQPISALLIATAFSAGPTDIFVENPGEKPWVALTLSWFDFFNIKYTNENFSHYRVEGNAQIKGFEKHIEPDFSSLTFLIVAALITNSEITINNFDLNNQGGDKQFITCLQNLGANFAIDETAKTLTIKKGSKLKDAKIDVNDFIDALPILAVLGCFVLGKTHLYNAKIARNKESDRIAAISEELKKMGAKITELEDGMIIEKSTLKGAKVFSHFDHRIAMSLCVAALNASGETIIENTSCIKKSYPSFFEDLKNLKAQIEIS